jgi:hypothetical protein
VPEGADPAFAKNAAAWFHEAGLSEKQGQNLAGKWNEHIANQMKAEQAAEQDSLRLEHAELQKEWGNVDSPSYNVQKEFARRAAQSLGFKDDAITTLETVTGFSAVMKGLANLGKSLAEATGQGLNDGGNQFAMTPGQAVSKRAQLLADKEWGKRAMSASSKEFAELRRLDEIITQGQ